MSNNAKRPWYAHGLAFECNHCGQCCSGPAEGYVWVEPPEVAELAEFLGFSVEEVSRRYTRKVGRRISLIEQSNADCIFLRTDGQTKTCTVYSARPIQCRTWPFWRSNLTGPVAWAHAGKRCVGINRGPLHDLDHIEHEKSRLG